MTPRRDSASPEETLPRVLGLTEVTASGVAIIIGAGIYVLLGPASEVAGGLVWMSFLVAAALCALTAFSYAELASMFPRASAEHEFARHGAPPWVAFTVGWAMLTGLMVAAATVSLGFARYAGEHVNLPHRVLAWLLLICVAMVASLGMRRESWIVNLFSLAQVAGLLFLIVIGIDHFGEVNLWNGAPDASGNPVSFSGSFPGIMSGAALLFFAYIGFDEVVTLSDDTKNPSRTIPRALILALFISTILYVLVAVSAANVLTPDVLAESDYPLSDMARHAAGGWAAGIVSILAMMTTIDTTLLAVTASSRITYGMAATDDLPKVLHKVSRLGAPRNGVLLVTSASAALVAIGDLEIVAQATDFLVYLVFLAVNALLIRLRFTIPEASRPFRVRGTVKRVPINAVLGILVTVVMIPYLDWQPIAVGSGLVVAGIGVWFLLSAGKTVRR